MPDLVKSIKDVVNPRKSFSSQEILNHMVGLADIMTKKFHKDMLYDSAWNSDFVDAGGYNHLVKQASKELGFHDSYYTWGYCFRPPSEYQQTGKGFSSGLARSEISLEGMTVLDEELFNKTDDFMIRHYIFSTDWDRNDHYYLNQYEDPKYMGVFRKIYDLSQKLKGRKDMNKTLDGIKLLLTKQNPDNSAVGLHEYEGDLYTYKDKFFFVRHPITYIGDYGEYDGKLFYLTTDKTRFQDLFLNWACAIFSYKQLDSNHYESKPIAYKILNYKEKQKLPMSSANYLTATSIKL
jgi:hypothetical protein